MTSAQLRVMISGIGPKSDLEKFDIGSVVMNHVFKKKLFLDFSRVLHGSRNLSVDILFSIFINQNNILTGMLLG